MSPGRLSLSDSSAPCSLATASTRLNPRPLPGVRAGGVQPHETLQHPRPVPCGNTRPVVGDRDDRTAGGALDLETHLTPRRRVLDGVVEQIGQRLRQQVPVRAHLQSWGAAILQAQVFVLGGRPVEIGEVVAERLQIDHLEAAALAAGFRARDVEQGVEGRDHRLRVRQRRLEQGARLCAAGLLQQRHLDARAQPVERRAQIVRDVVGDLAHAAEQPLDLVEHGVEVGRQLIELVARASERDALAEIARHDLAGGAIDRVDAPEHAPAHQKAAGEAEEKRERKAPAQRAPDHRLQLQILLDLAPDQEPEAIAEQEGGGAGPAPFDALAIGTDLDREGQPAVRVGGDLGPAIEIAGDPPASRVDQQIHAGAVRLRGAAAPDHLAQAVEPLRAILLGEPGDLRLDRLGGLPLHESGGGVVEETEQRQCRDPEGRQINQRQAEGRGVKQPPQAHGHSIRPLVRCGSAGARIPGRSSDADG